MISGEQRGKPAGRVQRSILAILVFAAAHGLIYAFVMPPWQHYDEPSHFEYAWFIAHHGRLPGPDEHDPVAQRAIMKSMAVNAFFGPTAPTVDALSDAELYLGYTQLSDPPGYYLLAAVPIWLFRDSDVATQLRAARLVSVGLLVLTVAAGAGAARALTTAGSALRWMTPFTIAALPAFADLMSAVSNDAAGIAAASWAVYFAVRLLTRGLSIRASLGLFVSLGACVIANRAALPALALLPLVGILLIRHPRWLSGLILLGGSLAALLILAPFEDVQAWYRGTLQAEPLWSASSDGNAALRLVARPGRPTDSVLQLIPPDDVQVLRGKPLRLSGVLVSEPPAEVRLPWLRAATNTGAIPGEFEANQVKQFGGLAAPFEVSVTIPLTATRAWVIFAPAPAGQTSSSQVFLDDLRLSEDGAPNLNWIRNSGMDGRGPRIRLWESDFRSRFFWGLEEYDFLTAPFDLQATGSLFIQTARKVGYTFCCTFAWGSVPSPKWVYDYFWLLCIGAALGWLALVATLRHRAKEYRAAVALALFTAVVAAAVMIRSVQSLIYIPYVANARYGYPALIPIMLAFSLGWRELGDLAGRILARSSSASAKFGRARAGAAIVFVIAWLTLDAAGIATVSAYFRAP
ncbi:MAG: hypothetical protein ABIQ99_10365 [Thermoflexales bacterium]